ncbi:MAG: glycosyltransferase [Thiocapsa sp.]|jgi:glycosyltransferase involved in cell wall biosynthesis|nr:glycosyltransferase [Thiocapsa sp.]MCG6896046.1 glycosyltransferase [Thiocapsa sp.]MCG6986349.1 glycosyltransferase [Thiocapsa sp.]
MKASVIIPALNESKLLPGLLDRLDRQTFRDFEVVVADAGSSDGTREICKSRGVVLTDGGMPAVGRNRGAALARGEWLFFLDADVMPPPDFLAKALGEMTAEGIRLATCSFEPDSDRPLDQLLFELANLYVRLSLKSDPHAGGFAIFVDHTLFDRVGGFDEQLRLAEDHDFVKRAARYAPLHLLQSTSIRMSVRRLEKDGRFSYSAKCIQVELYRLFKGEITEDIVDYQFGYGESNRDVGADEALKRLSDRIAAWKRQHAETIRRVSHDMQDSPELTATLAELRRTFNTLKDAVQSYLSR